MFGWKITPGLGDTMTQQSQQNELYAIREKRISDAIALTTPDRVPITLSFGSFDAQYTGTPMIEYFNDIEKHLAANWKTNKDFAPDLASPPTFFGPMCAALDCKVLKWGGYGLPPTSPYQYVEGEYMKEDEYDHFLFDISDFIVRKYWPRAFGKLNTFGALPPLNTIINYGGGAFGFASFGTPEGKATLDALHEAGKRTLDYLGAFMPHAKKLAAAGFPLLFSSMTTTPFDSLGDVFRGTKGLMLDMYRRPDKVIAACEKLLPIKIQEAVAMARMTHNPRVFIPLHKGSEGFMNQKQFEKFYWPTFRGLLTGLINEGLNPLAVVEGRYGARLETIKDVPSGKIIYWFEDTDMVRAKEVLRETACIMGNVPASLLVAGTPAQIRTYCKNLIDTVAQDGGFIMSAGCSPEDAKPENMQAMFDATREYGAY